MNVIVGWIVGNTQSGPHSFRKKKPFGWQYSDGLVTQSYHEAEVARLRAEVEGLRDGLEAIYQFGSDTLRGPTGDTPDDRQWHRTAVLEMTNRASRTVDTGSWKA